MALRPRQPDILTLGPGTRLVSLQAISAELGIPPEDARLFLGFLGIPLQPIKRMSYVNLGALELELWKRTHLTRGAHGPPLSDEEALRLINKFGTIYSGLRRADIQKRLRDALRPIKRAPRPPKPLLK